MKALLFIPALVTAVATAAYFSPWYAPDPWAIASLHYLGLLWLLVAWVLIPVHGYMAFRAKGRKEALWRWYAISASAIAIQCGAVVIAMSRGYFVTV
jgi:hypothetical protein